MLYIDLPTQKHIQIITRLQLVNKTSWRSNLTFENYDEFNFFLLLWVENTHHQNCRFEKLINKTPQRHILASAHVICAISAKIH